MEGSDTPHVIRIPMGTDESVQSMTQSHLPGDVFEDSILIVLCDIAIDDEIDAARALNQHHVALPHVNEMNHCAHDPLHSSLVHHPAFFYAHQYQILA